MSQKRHEDGSTIRRIETGETGEKRETERNRLSVKEIVRESEGERTTERRAKRKIKDL